MAAASDSLLLFNWCDDLADPLRQARSMATASDSLLLLEWRDDLSPEEKKSHAILHRNTLVRGMLYADIARCQSSKGFYDYLPELFPDLSRDEKARSALGLAWHHYIFGKYAKTKRRYRPAKRKSNPA